jgi:hypothetical protein
MNYLNEKTQLLLRNSGFISTEEVALKEGDLFVALNVTTQSRRILSLSGRILEAVSISENMPSIQSESSRRILKG